MAKQRVILVLVVCFSVAVFTGQTLSQKPSRPPRIKRGMTSEEHKKAMEEWLAQRGQQERERNEERMKLMAREAWKRLLRVNDKQLKLIEPKFEKKRDLGFQSRVGAGSGIRRTRNEQYFHWNRPSDSPYHPMKGKARDQMTEGYRIVEELIDLLEDENSTDEQIRKKIDTLQQAREKARKALPEAKKELAEVLTTPRQEAIFLIMGYID